MMLRLMEQLMIIIITIRHDLRRILKVSIPYYDMQMRLLRISRAKAVPTNQRASQRAWGNEPIRASLRARRKRAVRERS